MSRSQKNGSPYPLGCSTTQGFWNFAVFSETEVESLVVAPHAHPEKLEFYSLQKTGRIYHVAIEAKESAIRWGVESAQ